MRTKAPPHGLHFDLEGVDPISIDVFRAFMRTIHLHSQAMRRSLAAQGRGFSQVGCLRALRENEGISQKDLAEFLHLSRPSVTTMLNGMEQEGLIVRSTDEVDRRLTRVRLTKAGRALEREMRSGVSDYINHTVGSIPVENRKTLARLLDELADSISNTLTDSSTEEGLAE